VASRCQPHLEVARFGRGLPGDRHARRKCCGGGWFNVASPGRTRQPGAENPGRRANEATQANVEHHDTRGDPRRVRSGPRGFSERRVGAVGQECALARFRARAARRLEFDDLSQWVCGHYAHPRATIERTGRRGRAKLPRQPDRSGCSGGRTEPKRFLAPPRPRRPTPQSVVRAPRGDEWAGGASATQEGRDDCRRRAEASGEGNQVPPGAHEKGEDPVGGANPPRRLAAGAAKTEPGATARITVSPGGG